MEPAEIAHRILLSIGLLLMLWAATIVTFPVTAAIPLLFGFGAGAVYAVALFVVWRKDK